jgi:hypothetical protein
MFRTCAALAVLLAGPAIAQTCYRLPFSNPTLSDGWGSTCCGRTNPHRGVDFPRAAGTAIPSVADGVVKLKTYSSCLGNVVVIQHGDGMFSGYSHMSTGSPLAVGQAVSIGQTVGQVGNTGTCSQGAHLHLTMSATLGGYASGVTVDPYKWIIARTTCNRPPTGAFDSATCEGISGWVQDPDVATSAIPAHVYLGGAAGNPAATGFNLRADVYRTDLCTAIGSCSHGFSAGGANTLLGQKTLQCANAPLPTFEAGLVRRHLPGVEVMTAWKLGLGDIAPLSDATLDAIPNGPDLSPTPVVLRADGNVDVFVREYDVLRHVQSVAAMDAWKLTHTSVPAAQLDDAIRGAAWPSRPFLARGSGAKVYLLDAPPPLWAELVADDVPAQLAAGSTADVTFRFRNRGSLAWGAEVSLAPTPRDVDSALCDPSWTSCTRAAAFGEVLPGKEGAVSVRLRAPATVGDASICFGLVRGQRWFSDPGQNGPADDAICRTIQVLPAGTPVKPGGVKPVMGAPEDPTPVARGGCTQAGGSTFGGMFGLLAALGALRGRRRTTP